MDLLAVTRKTFTDKSTIGELHIDGKYFCATLEDTCRKVKVWGETAIPPGRYQVKFDFSPKYKRRMPYLLDVPGYQGIMIHPGNFPADTLGCILVGKHDEGTARDFISNSRQTFELLMNRLDAYRDQEIFVTVSGGFQHERRHA
jgi:hypothetical protein